MKKSIFALLLFVPALSFAQEDVRGKWRPKPITVDGFPTEWNNPLRLYNTETGLFFDIVNDSSTLFICFQSKDEPTQIKINKAGMKVEIKNKGKLKCDATIHFPLTGKKENITEEPHERQRPDLDHMKHGFVLQNIDFSAEGFATQQGVIPVKDTSGIRVAINWTDQNVMTYELAIPLKELFGTVFSLSELTKALTLKVEINAFTRPENRSPEDSPASNGGGMGMGGGAMGGGGGMSRGGGGGMGGGGHHSGGGHRGGNGAGQQSDGAKESMFDAKKMKQGFFLSQGH